MNSLVVVAVLALVAAQAQYVQLTTLPTRADVGKTYVGELATVTGWGRTSDDPFSGSDVLRFVSTPIVSNEDCIKYHIFLTPAQICADGSLIKSSCKGDSGGPLVVGVNRVQVGVVSYGSTDGCTKGYDVVYSRVTEYLDWIATHAAGVQIN